jgi:hypothetical protein
VETESALDPDFDVVSIGFVATLQSISAKLVRVILPANRATRQSSACSGGTRGERLFGMKLRSTA